jgi:hypothetical protein
VSAGIAVVVSIAGAIGSGVVIIAVLSTVSVSLSVLSPQEATNRPRERATIENFTNFMFLNLDGYLRFIPQTEKGNPLPSILFKINSDLWIFPSSLSFK